MKTIYSILVALIIGFLLFNCNGKRKTHTFVPKYNGPLIEVDSVNTVYTDSSVLKMKMKALKQLEFENGNREFPKGLILTFYKKNGVEDAIISGNHGKFDKAKGYYTLTGKVVVQNHKEHKKLETEVLNWNPNTKKVFTDKFVIITTPTERLEGTGLDAEQDFSHYEIREVSGISSLSK